MIKFIKKLSETLICKLFQKGINSLSKGRKSYRSFMKSKDLFIYTFSMVSCTMAPEMKKSDLSYPKEFKKKSHLFSSDSIQTSKWWTQFNNPELNNYVNKAIKNNLDIKSAVERVKQFEAIVGISSAPLYPQINASASATKLQQKMINNFIPQKGDYIDIDTEQYDANLKFIFNIDIWGKFRNIRYAAVADWKAMKYDLQLFYQNIIAQTISSYIELTAIQAQVELSSKTVKSYKSDLRRQKKRYRLGIGSKYALDLTRQVLTANQAKFEVEKAVFLKMKYQFSLLLGEYPNEDFKLVENLGEITKIPISLPSRLLKQRPDIQAAYQRMDAARNRVGAARADFFPDLSLSGILGWGVKDLADLFKGDLLNKTLTGVLSQTIFDGFSKTSTLNKRWAEYEYSFLNYKKVILKSFADTESSLVELQSQVKQYHFFEVHKKSSQNTFKLVHKRYISGITSYKDVLDNKRMYFNAELSLIRAKRSKLLAQLRLHQAIGGNWY